MAIITYAYEQKYPGKKKVILGFKCLSDVMHIRTYV